MEFGLREIYTAVCNTVMGREELGGGCGGGKTPIKFITVNEIIPIDLAGDGLYMF